MWVVYVISCAFFLSAQLNLNNFKALCNDCAFQALNRLHQLEILGHTLVVEVAKGQDHITVLKDPPVSDRSASCFIVLILMFYHYVVTPAFPHTDAKCGFVLCSLCLQW